MTIRTAGSLRLTGVALTTLMLVTTVSAQTLNVGVVAEPTSIDPHFFRSGPNMSVRENVSDALVYNNQVTGEVEARIAASWEVQSETSWRFALNPNAKFADDKAVSAADVIFSLCRVRNVAGSPGPYISFVETIENVEADGEGAVVITTNGPDPVLLQSLSALGIIQSPTGALLDYDRETCGNTEWIGTELFNNGTVRTGIAPYYVTEYQPGIQTVLQRNDDYYGEKPHYERVVLKSIPENGARIAALLSGGVDVIDGVPVNAIDQIADNEALELISMPASRLIFFAFDQEGEPTPKISGTDGKNPFKDVRVREALNLAVDRMGIVDTIMDGIAEPAAGIVMARVFGHNPDLALSPYDPVRARELLAEAGYPDGFELAINAPNDRYRNDAEVAQAVAQNLAQVGIKVTLETLPQSVYFDRASKFEFSLFMGGASADSGEGMSQLLNLVHTRDGDRGLGGANRGRYSSEITDGFLEKALVTLDEEERRGLLQSAEAQVHADFAYLPLYHEVAVWAARSDVYFEPNAAQLNVVYTARPKN